MTYEPTDYLPYDFANRRHIGPSPEEMADMLETVGAESLEALPEGASIVVYCYTGHTGQAAATALMLLGYDVKNLKFGMMGWSDVPEVVATSGGVTAAGGYPTAAEG